MDTIIRSDGLRRAYGDVPAVRDVSFTVERGEVFGLLGPNGAGKTTTVECLQGLRSRDGGSVEVLGLDPARHPDRLRRHIGAQLQSAALPDRLRVGEAVRFFARLQDRPVDVDRTLEEWDLTRLRRRPYAVLSGGQRQRLFLALALLGSPEVVFLDELTAALDPAARRATWELVRGVRDRGATIVLVTHFMEEAEALCDRVAIVDDGRVVALDTPAALTAGSGGDVHVTFSADGREVAFLRALPGVTSFAVADGEITVAGDPATPVRLAAALAEHGIFPPDFRTHHPSLEDVFLARTGRSLTTEVTA
ncbi:ABC transporter ATP-binding protein [Egibacter rhizosphaerae]|uniref:ABC transporter ATP-binding protein n=1 Tax=Egibacter rhizosphaerae TaxID=1670831 RepID=A0A411YFS8_9ACTN|nr:ABC transporter ATP-binding protein [Egibacter rhizosphaerae]QBI19962.1 ABC transporter ATP-binding protein [Egibacter rhizosphaerae]